MENINTTDIAMLMDLCADTPAGKEACVNALNILKDTGESLLADTKERACRMIAESNYGEVNDLLQKCESVRTALDGVNAVIKALQQSNETASTRRSPNLRGFTYNGRFYEVHTWKKAVVCLMNVLHHENPAAFLAMTHSPRFSDSRMPKFSDTLCVGNDGRPKNALIPGTDVYVYNRQRVGEIKTFMQECVHEYDPYAKDDALVFIMGDGLVFIMDEDNETAVEEDDD